MKIQLSISKDYAPSWGTWQGVREIMQNWMDAFEEGDYVEHDGTRLNVVNESGALRQQDIAVLGSSTKFGDGASRGQFGDGLKVGCLALVREGLTVRFKTGGYWYRASIEQSKEHGAEVLTFRSRRAMRKDDGPEDGVRFVIEGLTRSQWDEMRGRFIFEPGRRGVIEERPGAIFVKDIWVCDRAGFAFGYNLDDAEVGRDRDLVSDFNVRYYAGKALARALDDGEISAQRVMGLLEDGAAEAEYVQSFITSKGRAAVKTVFEETHGDEAVAVHTDEDHRTAEHLGLRPVIVNKALVQTVPEVRNEKMSADSVILTYAPTDLSREEDMNLQCALMLVGEERFDGLKIEIVKFAEESQLGSRDGGTINVSRLVLSNSYKTVKVLVEELAHTAGGDGSLPHKHAIHDIYVDVIKRIL